MDRLEHINLRLEQEDIYTLNDILLKEPKKYKTRCDIIREAVKQLIEKYEMTGQT